MLNIEESLLMNEEKVLLSYSVLLCNVCFRYLFLVCNLLIHFPQTIQKSVTVKLNIKMFIM